MDAGIKKEILDQLQIDEAVYEALLKDFAAEVKLVVPKLRDAFLCNDAAVLKKMLHSLKGTSENLRIKKMVVTVDILRGLIGEKKSEDVVNRNLMLLQVYAENIENAF